jgi:HEAT repeat protein
MHAARLKNPGQADASLLRRAARLVLLSFPGLILLLCSLRTTGLAANLLGVGAVFQVLVCGLAIHARRGLREPLGAQAIVLYVIALSWLLLAAARYGDWFFQLAQAILLTVPLLLFALQCLRESGAPALRRARLLSQRLAARREWPADLQSCRLLPEVKALRDALQVDAAPVFPLLADPRPQVRVAALAALEYRQNWRPQQPEVVLQLAQKAPEAEVRAAAVNALANLDDRIMIEALAAFLCDPARLVRQTAAEALLWNTEHNWQWIRLAVRKALADPVAKDDGPLRHEASVYVPEAVTDLTAWASEKGNLAVRAAYTLGAHYHQVISMGGSAITPDLRRQLGDVHTPVILRLELARVLGQHRELDNRVLLDMLSPANPAPLRLIAAEELLQQGSSAEAVAALHDLARLPNRETALSIAHVIQRRLGVDLGLPRDQPLPAVHSRLAAEVARRVLEWAGRQQVSVEDSALPSDALLWRS